MPIRTVIVNEIHHDANAANVRLLNQLVEVLLRPVERINRTVIGNVIAVVDHGRRIDRRQPDCPDAE